MAFSHELLRTFAAVPVASRVLVREDRPAGHAEALVQLGFHVQARVPAAEKESLRHRMIACQPSAATWRVLAIGAPLPEAAYDWTVWALPDAPAPGGLAEELKRIRSALRPGGWCYVLTPEGVAPPGDPPDQPMKASATLYTPHRLAAWADTARLAEASAPWHVAQEGALHAIYRRVESDTPG